MRTALLACALLVVTAASAWAEEPPDGAVPFPVGRSTTVRADDGPIFFIDGPTVIPKSAEIGVELDVKIYGINGASLDVQGGLKVRGTQNHWVVIRNVDFSPTRHPRKGFHLDMVSLYGVTFRHAEGPAFEGELTIENAAVQRDCVFDVRMKKGLLKLMTIEWGTPTTITCEPEQARTKDVLVQVRSSWMREVRLTGPCDVTFRHSQIRGGLHLHNVTKATVDGCDVTGQLAVRQGAEDRFKGLKISKVNLYGPAQVILERALNPDAKAEKVRLDKCCFVSKTGAGLIAPKAIAELVQDGVDEPERRVTARITSPAKRPHQLVNYGDLRLRVPAVE